MPHKNFLFIAERQKEKLIHELENTFRVPPYLAQHTETTIDNYKYIIHQLLKENRILKEDLIDLKDRL